MPRLATIKHPEFARRNGLIVQAFLARRKRATIAKAFNLSMIRVAQILREYNASRRIRTRKPLTPAQEDEIIRQWDAKVTRASICKEFDIHPRTLRRVLIRRNSYTKRPPGGFR